MSESKKEPCACGKKFIRVGIRQIRLGKNHWQIHDLFECYEMKDGYKTELGRKRLRDFLVDEDKKG